MGITFSKVSYGNGIIRPYAFLGAELVLPLESASPPRGEFGHGELLLLEEVDPLLLLISEHLELLQHVLVHHGFEEVEEIGKIWGALITVTVLKKGKFII